MTPTISIPAGASRTFPFFVKRGGVALDLTDWTATVVVKEDEAAVTPLFSTECPIQVGDSTARLVTFEGAATELAADVEDVYRPACVHVVSPDGKPDVLEVVLYIYRHA